MQHKILRFLGSRTFLYGIVGIFTLEAIWIALTGRYPGAFDENFHFGLIQLYAKHWSPFLDAQPPNAEVYGAVARDPSYLYHYLMSFPYRLIAVFTQNQTVQIVLLRLLNVALAAGSVLLYARVLRRTSLPRFAQNAVLVLFTMIPVMPLLAGQINYDSLLFILVAIAMILVLDFTEALRGGRFEITTAAKFVAMCLLASLTKYAFLPIFAAFGLYALVVLIRHRKDMHPLRMSALGSYVRNARKIHLIGYSVLILLAGGLFIQRYGVNLARYHTPVPDCSQVITVKECSAYAPWQRDYLLEQTNASWKREHIGKYTDMWVHQMVRETYFSAYAVFFPDGTVDYKVVDPLPFMTILGWSLLVSGLLATAITLPKLWRNPMLQLFALVVLLYVLALFVQNFKAYRETAVPVSIHGRYVLPVLPFALVIIFYAYRELVRWVMARVSIMSRYRTQLMLAGWFALLVLCVQGGGIVTHIIRSDSDWFWQQNPHAQKANDKARVLLRPFVIENKL